MSNWGMGRFLLRASPGKAGAAMMPRRREGLKMRIASLHIYPIKGVRAVDLDKANVEDRGLAGDRRWLVVDEKGVGITQRSHSRLATITARQTEQGLHLSAPGAEDLLVAAPSGAARSDIKIWDDDVSAALADERAHRWLSSVLDDALRLVFMDGGAQRAKANQWTPASVPTSFADAYPILIATTGSLRSLNEEIAKSGGDPVTMRRFRPNLVIDCEDPWREDYWKTLRIGRVELDLVKPCDRCVVTTKDQATGESMGKEPLESLVRIRRSGDRRVKGVLFGWNAAPRGLGEVAVGDEVEILEDRPEGFPIIGR